MHPDIYVVVGTFYSEPLRPWFTSLHRSERGCLEGIKHAEAVLSDLASFCYFKLDNGYLIYEGATTVSIAVKGICDATRGLRSIWYTSDMLVPLKGHQLVTVTTQLSIPLQEWLTACEEVAKQYSAIQHDELTKVEKTYAVFCFPKDRLLDPYLLSLKRSAADCLTYIQGAEEEYSDYARLRYFELHSDHVDYGNPQTAALLFQEYMGGNAS